MAKRTSPTLAQLLGVIDELAPASLAESYDNVGLQIGNRSKTLRRVLVGLEVSDALIDEALKIKAQAIVVHHPLFFLPIKRLDESDLVGHFARRLVKSDIALIAAHTNLDKAPGGTNTVLAEKLGVEETRVLLPETVGKDFKFVVFVPVGHEAKVIGAIAAAGGGVIGNYDHCSFRSPGTGAFRGNEESNPAIGAAGKIEEVSELRVEALVPQSTLAGVIDAMRAAHPYEEVAFDVYPLEKTGGEFGLGLLGSLKRPLSLRSFAERVKKSLKLKAVKMVGDSGQTVRRVAIATGSCDFLVRQLGPPRVDCLVTGDVKYHMAVEARERGLGVIDPGHWASEVIVTGPLAKALQSQFDARGCDVEFIATQNPDPDPLVTV